MRLLTVTVPNNNIANPNNNAAPEPTIIPFPLDIFVAVNPAINDDIQANAIVKGITAPVGTDLVFTNTNVAINNSSVHTIAPTIAPIIMDFMAFIVKSAVVELLFCFTHIPP